VRCCLFAARESINKSGTPHQHAPETSRSSVSIYCRMYVGSLADVVQPCSEVCASRAVRQSSICPRTAFIFLASDARSASLRVANPS
jgi:hypothetical protein